ncbi:Kinesin-like protein kif27 [Phlyctochytrium planicorne]|nr:Kinesin-like protein kif27 [Phlyctochytrium planicorne]
MSAMQPSFGSRQPSLDQSHKQSEETDHGVNHPPAPALAVALPPELVLEAARASLDLPDTLAPGAVRPATRDRRKSFTDAAHRHPIRETKEISNTLSFSPPATLKRPHSKEPSGGEHAKVSVGYPKVHVVAEEMAENPVGWLFSKEELAAARREDDADESDKSNHLISGAHIVALTHLHGQRKGESVGVHSMSGDHHFGITRGSGSNDHFGGESRRGSYQDGVASKTPAFSHLSPHLKSNHSNDLLGASSWRGSAHDSGPNMAGAGAGPRRASFQDTTAGAAKGSTSFTHAGKNTLRSSQSAGKLHGTGMTRTTSGQDVFQENVEISVAVPPIPEHFKHGILAIHPHMIKLSGDFSHGHLSQTSFNSFRNSNHFTGENSSAIIASMATSSVAGSVESSGHYIHVPRPQPPPTNSAEVKTPIDFNAEDPVESEEAVSHPQRRASAFMIRTGSTLAKWSQQFNPSYAKKLEAVENILTAEAKADDVLMTGSDLAVAQPVEPTASVVIHESFVAGYVEWAKAKVCEPIERKSLFFRTWKRCILVIHLIQLILIPLQMAWTEVFVSGQGPYGLESGASGVMMERTMAPLNIFTASNHVMGMYTLSAVVITIKVIWDILLAVDCFIQSRISREDEFGNPIYFLHRKSIPTANAGGVEGPKTENRSKIENGKYLMWDFFFQRNIFGYENSEYSANKEHGPQTQQKTDKPSPNSTPAPAAGQTPALIPASAASSKDQTPSNPNPIPSQPSAATPAAASTQPGIPTSPTTSPQPNSVGSPISPEASPLSKGNTTKRELSPNSTYLLETIASLRLKVRIGFGALRLLFCFPWEILHFLVLDGRIQQNSLLLENESNWDSVCSSYRYQAELSGIDPFLFCQHKIWAVICFLKMLLLFPYDELYMWKVPRVSMPASRLTKTMLFLIIMAHLDTCIFWYTEMTLPGRPRWVDSMDLVPHFRSNLTEDNTSLFANEYHTKSTASHIGFRRDFPGGRLFSPVADEIERFQFQRMQLLGNLQDEALRGILTQGIFRAESMNATALNSTQEDALLELVSPTFRTQYLKSFLTSVRCLELKPRPVVLCPELIFSIFEWLIGILVYGSIAGNMHGIITLLDRDAVANETVEKYKLEMTYFATVMKREGLPPDLQIKANSYKKLVWARTKGVDEDFVFKDLPPPLLQSIKNHFYLDLVKTMPMFSNADQSFLNNTVLFTNGLFIFRKGDPGEEMYIIHSGEVEIVIEADGAPKVIVTLGPGKIFGEVALFESCKRTAGARAKGTVELCMLQKEPFNSVLMANPEMAEKIMSSVNTYKENDGKRKVAPPPPPPPPPSAGLEGGSSLPFTRVRSTNRRSSLRQPRNPPPVPVETANAK